jgi:hypothetical protein
LDGELGTLEQGLLKHKTQNGRIPSNMGMNYGGAKRRAAKFTVVFVGRLVVGLLAPNATCCV